MRGRERRDGHTPSARGAGNASACTMVRCWVGRVSATYSARRPWISDSTIRAGSTTTTPSSSRPFDHADRHDGDLAVEAGASSPARAAMPAASSAARHLVDQRRRGRRRRRSARRHAVVEHGDGRRRHGGTERLARRAACTIGGDGVADAHRCRRPQPRRRGGHHPVGELHDLGRDAVADRQPDDAGSAVVGQVARARRPSRRGASGPVAWAMSPTTVIEPLSERRAAMRSCIGVRSCTSSIDDVAVRADLVGVVDLAVLAGAGPSTSRASSSRATSARRPAHVVDASERGRRSSARSRRPSRTVGRPGAAAPVEPNRSWSSCAGVSTGHIRSSAARTSGTLRSSSAHLGRATTSSRRATRRPAPPRPRPRRSGAPALWRRNRRRAGLTMRAGVLDAQAQVAGAEAARRGRSRQRPLAVARPPCR